MKTPGRAGPAQRTVAASALMSHRAISMDVGPPRYRRLRQGRGPGKSRAYAVARARMQFDVGTSIAMTCRRSGCFPTEIRHRIVQHAENHRAVFACETLLHRPDPAPHRLDYRAEWLSTDD